MRDYITRVKANVSIYATKKTSSVLDGTYVSVFMGRSMNFEDLREYVPGDSIRDIDWKASSRNRNLLVKRYVAEKKHNILLLFDTGSKMDGDTVSGHSKKEVALMTAGTIAYLAYKNGDNIGSLYNCDGKIQYFPFKSGLVNVQRILAEADSKITLGKRNSLEKSLSHVAQRFNRKMIIFVITDRTGISEASSTVLKRLTSRNDVLFVNIEDAEIMGNEGLGFDVTEGYYIPAFIRSNKKLKKLEEKTRSDMDESNSRKLISNGISCQKINSEEEIITGIIELLEKHKNANRR